MPEVLQISRLNCEATVPSSKHPNFTQWSMRAAESAGVTSHNEILDGSSGRFATFVAIPFACWAFGGTRARWKPRTVPSIGLIHSTLRLIHCLTTVGRFCNVFLEKRELRPCCIRIRGSHRALVPPDAQHAKGIATKVSNRNPKCELCPLRFSETIRRPSHLRSLATRCE